MSTFFVRNLSNLSKIKYDKGSPSKWGGVLPQS